MTHTHTLVPACGFAAALVTSAHAQLSITWSTIDGGGGRSVGGAFVLRGTIGQPDAGVSASGIYQCAGGFWGGSATASCDSIDFNADGVFPDSQDIADFLSVFGGGPCSNDPLCHDIDFNNDAVFPDSQDINDFLNVFAGGAC